MLDARWDQTAYDLHGSANAPSLVLIHGLGLHRGLWRRFLPALSARYHVLTYDLYGHGKSGASPTTTSLDLYAEQLHGLISHVGLSSATIAGFSLGGMINRRFAMTYPEMTDALIIMNSPHARAPDWQRKVEAQAEQSADGGPAATIDAALLRWFTEEFRNRSPESVEEIREWVLSCNADSYAQARRVLAFGIKELIAPQPALNTPALIITSEHDIGSTPAMARAMKSEMPNSRLHAVPGLKHLGLVEKPDLFISPILDFLRGQTSQAEIQPDEETSNDG
ncbi:alpha/beta fold hydrolase [Paracoccus saliphilus]|uniref:3-oxoadipate enol-lactonase n=1 Tax=Paracoccus saliphilus TaxID=405559 RepID=A0AA45W671_9RHOB|nr:alpha/beta hydrolase [Paracoccus saliphilus]WCR01504.1 alpha/beta fold hydrolase [Paracoccus saliphilus]SIS99537.1 3-oxoadipate enol-lactonase [Paracoccus saliphilus]